MTRGAKPHPAEIVVEWFAAGALSAASGWSAWSVTATPLTALAAAGAALAMGKLAMHPIGHSHAGSSENAFSPLAFEDVIDVDELLLDDPLVAVEPDSRVVRLFERQEATPGELVAKIADFLGDRGAPAAAEAHDHRPVDASAALHAALANVRACLR